MKIDNTMDIIDSRDVIERIEELAARNVAGERLGDDEYNEYMTLLDLQEEARLYGEEWEHGVPLVRDSYFVEYAQQLADDLGLIDESTRWAHNHIDWVEVADDLKLGYAEIGFGGVAYWQRGDCVLPGV